MGIYYQPPKYVEQDRDMLEIQKWLIGDPNRLRMEHWINVAYTIATGFVITVMVLMYARN
jgi:putative ubiquitin-RnfH superfamily antitoxin RatB of RatAB toxin-antitoxin module